MFFPKNRSEPVQNLRNKHRCCISVFLKYVVRYFWMSFWWTFISSGKVRDFKTFLTVGCSVSYTLLISWRLCLAMLSIFANCSITYAGSWTSVLWASSWRISLALLAVGILLQLLLSRISVNSSRSTVSKSDCQDSNTVHSDSGKYLRKFSTKSLLTSPKAACSNRTGAIFTGRYFSLSHPKAIIRPTLSHCCCPKSCLRKGTFNVLPTVHWS